MSNAFGRLGRAVRSAPANTPLRVKLVTALLALVALALTVAGLAGTTALRTYLLARVDANLATSARDFLEHGGRLPPADSHGGPALSTAYYTQVTNAGGAGFPGRLELPPGAARRRPRGCPR